MGATYRFVCPACGYEAEVSAGRDLGLASETATRHCLDCCELVDILAATRLEGEAARVGRCPNCGSRFVRDWDPESRPCPRCGSAMDRRELSSLWD